MPIVGKFKTPTPKVPSPKAPSPKAPSPKAPSPQRTTVVRVTSPPRTTGSVAAQVAPPLSARVASPHRTTASARAQAIPQTSARVASPPPRTTASTQNSGAPSVWWIDRLQDWKNGKNIPKIKENIYFECSPIFSKRLNKGIYIEEHIKETGSNIHTVSDYDAFKDKMDRLDNNVNFTSFENPKKDCMLVSPSTKKYKDKNFANIHLFYKKSNSDEIKELWKKVAETALEFMKKHDKVWISTNGTGVGWVHIRICNKPKYYNNEELRNM